MTYTVVAPTGTERAEWLGMRNDGIGSSEAAAALGLSPWKSPFVLYHEKTGQLEPDDQTEPQYIGRMIEPTIAAIFADQHPMLTVLDPGAITYRSVEYPFLFASPDRIVRPAVGEEGGLELKNVGIRMAADWGEFPPDFVQLQCLHQMAVLGWEWCWVAALIGGNEYRGYLIERNDAAIAGMLQAEEEFWRAVVERRPPPVDGSESTREALRAMHAESIPDSELELPQRALGIRVERDAFKAQAKTLEGLADQAEAELMALLGENEVGVVDGQRLITWQPERRKRVDVHALREAEPDIAERFATVTESRVARFPKLREQP